MLRGSMAKGLSKDVKIFWEACDLEEKGDMPQAIALYNKAIEYGSAESCINLANYYIESDLKELNMQAIALYAIAYDMGDCGGAWNIYNYFKNSNKLLADYWLQKAADLGDEDAQNLL
jgi:TPR repeat protein